MSTAFHADVLRLDARAAAGHIQESIRSATGRSLGRRGVVLGVSGGVDSAVCLALAAASVGAGKVTALLMPERESDPDATETAARLCDQLGVAYVVEDIGGALAALGCYERRDAAIRQIFPEFGPGWKQKVAIAASVLETDRINYFNLTVESPDGERRTSRMPASVYSGVVAATNMKQRVRKLIEYYHAESLNFAVLGTPNRLEYELGFFVRGGDGLADLKPVAHLYKSQVYMLADYFDLPHGIRTSEPTTDTYTLPQTQDEFYFALPYRQMDLLLWAWEHQVAPGEAAAVMQLRPDEVERVYRDIVRKREAARRNLAGAILAEEVELDGRK